MKDLWDTTWDGTFSGMDDSFELDSLKRVKDKEKNKNCEETKLDIINKDLNLTSMHGDIYSQINPIIFMNEDSNNNDSHKIINFESYRKREKKELEKLDLNEKKIIHVKSQTNYENNSEKQKLKSLIDAKSGSVLWEIHLEDIEAMIQLGERQSIIYPPWIQFRYDKWDPILKDLYDKLMKRWAENFGFGIKLIPIKSKEIESYIISEVLHQNTINENEDINSRRSLLNPNVDLTEVFDSLKKHSIKNLKSKNPLPVNVLKDLSSALKLDLQKHYEDWLAYILSIFNGEEVFTLDNLQTIYQYFDNTQRKHSIEKKSSKVWTIKGPFVYLYQIKRHSKLWWVKENKNLQRLFSTILKKYNEELENAIKQMKLIMINIACNEGYNLEKMVEDLNRLVVKKLKENEDPYAIFLNLEKRRDWNYDDREEIVYNQMLDYTISKGSVVETHFPNIKEHKVIISEELEKRVKNELLDKHFKWINSFEKEESYGEKHSDQIDRKKLKSDLFDFSQMRMDSYVEAELDKKRRKVKEKDFEIKENDIVSYSNNWIAEVERFKNNSNKFLEW